MIDAGWLNIGSLILGLVAWIIPTINLAGDKKQKNKKWVALTIISFSACAIPEFTKGFIKGFADGADF